MFRAVRPSRPRSSDHDLAPCRATPTALLLYLVTHGVHGVHGGVHGVHGGVHGVYTVFVHGVHGGVHGDGGSAADESRGC
eukprot:7380642-Prymnesium_polylepis.2